MEHPDADRSRFAAHRKIRRLPAGNHRQSLSRDEEALDVPEDNQFITVSEHDATNFRHGNAYGVIRSDGVVYIQITVFDTRTVDEKKAFFRRVAELLGEDPGIRPEDVFINMLESARENWSVGNGLAQFA